MGFCGKLCQCLWPQVSCCKLLVQLLAEWTGTFILVHVVCLSVNSFDIPALAQGVCLVALVFNLGHISGAHFNPAISLAVWLGGGIDLVSMLLYMVVQCAAGAVSGAIAGVVATDDGSFACIDVSGDDKIGLWTELCFTFLVVSSFINTACTKHGAYQGNSFFGTAVGFAYLAAVACGAYSGGAYNPAVVIGVNAGYTIFTTVSDDESVTDADVSDLLADIPDVGSWILPIIMEMGAGLLAGLWFLLTELVQEDSTNDEKAMAQQIETGNNKKYVINNQGASV